MPENKDSTPSLPEKRKSNGQFPKGKSGNPKGRGKGNLAKKTRFLQIMTSETQKRALKVLSKVIKQAENGHIDSQKMIVEILKPFLKREAEQEGGHGDRRPMININVGVVDGKKQVLPVRVIDGKTGAVDG